MNKFFGRLIAILFIGSFCIVGPLGVVIALGAAVQRTALIVSGLRADATVIGWRQSGSSHPTYAPVVQFTAIDGRTHTANSDVYGRQSAYRAGQHVGVLYWPDNPDSARLDSFGALWMFPLVFGIVGSALSIVPGIVVAGWIRRRRRGTGDLAPEPGAVSGADPPRTGLRLALGVVLTVGGLALLATGAGLLTPDAESVRESRVTILCMGVMLASSGILIAQWLPADSRLSDALGGTVMTAMAVLFGWVSLYGDAKGFSSSVGAGGAHVTTGGSVGAARIAFGIGAALTGLASLVAWKRAFRRR